MPVEECSARRVDLVEIDDHCPHVPYVELQVPEEAKEVVEIFISITSRDQGWGGSEGISYTWFDADVRRPDDRSNQQALMLASNRAANPEFFEHKSRYSVSSSGPPGHWVKALRPGDVVQIIPKATYPHWVNIVKECLVEMKYYVEDGPTSTELSTPVSNAAHYPTSLDSSLKEIRLLTIEPGQPEEPIKGLFSTTNLDEATSSGFHALSYVWGHSSDSVEIHVASSEADPAGAASSSYRPFHLSRSAYTALRQLRSEDRTLRIWVDALCINQDDLQERAEQVSLMSRIFSLASTVHIWLGEGQPTVKECFGIVRNIYNFHYRICPGGEGCNCTAERMETPHSLTPAQIVAAAPWARDTEVTFQWMHDLFSLTRDRLPEDVAEYAGGKGNLALSRFTEHLFSNPWFSRVWVIQEALLARKALLRYGDEMIPFHEAFIASKFLEHPTYLIPHIHARPILAPIWKSLNQVQSSQESHSEERMKQESILDVMLQGLDLKATDVRDKLFALLPFGKETHSSQDVNELIRPNYTKPPEQVFADFTRWWINSHGSLSILSAIHSQYGRTWRRTVRKADGHHLTRPTWAVGCTGKSKWAKVNLEAQFEFQATGKSVPVLSPTADPLRLRLLGKRVSVIEDMGHYPFEVRNPYEPNVWNVDIFPSAFEKLLDPCSAYGYWGPRHVWPETHGTTEEARQDCMRHYQNHLLSHVRYVPHPPAYTLLPIDGGGVEKYTTRSTPSCLDPCVFTTSDGQVGLCPWGSMKGDVIVLLSGGNVPYLVRPVESEEQSDAGCYEFVGECLLEDIMFGDFESVAGEEEYFELV